MYVCLCARARASQCVYINVGAGVSDRYMVYFIVSIHFEYGNSIHLTDGMLLKRCRPQHASMACTSLCFPTALMQTWPAVASYQATQRRAANSLLPLNLSARLIGQP